MADGFTGTRREGIRAYDPKTGTPVTVSRDEFAQKFASGELQLVEGMSYAMRGQDGALWDVPAKEAAGAFNKGYAFADRAEAVDAQAAAPDQAWRAAADGALNGALLGAGDAVQAKVFGVDPMDIEARAKHHAVARTIGNVGGIAATTLLTGGVGAPAGARVGAALAERIGAGALARAGAAGAEGAVEGAVYGVGQTMSEAALGRSDDVAERLMTNVGAGMLIGGGFGAGLSGVGSGARALWKAGRKAARLDDWAALASKGAGREVSRVEAASLKAREEAIAAAQAEHIAANKEANEAAQAYRERLLRERAAAGAKRGTMPGGKRGRAAAGAPEPAVGTADTMMSDASLEEAVHAERNRILNPAIERIRAKYQAAAGGPPSPAPIPVPVPESSPGAELAINAAARLAGGKAAVVGAGVGGAMAGVPGAFVGGVAGRYLGEKAARAALQRGLGESAERIGERAAAYVGRVVPLVNAAERAAERAGGALARMSPLTATALAGDARAFDERAQQVIDAQADPAGFAEHLARQTAPLAAVAPDAAAMVQSRAVDAMAYLAGKLPNGSQADLLDGEGDVVIDAQERHRFALIDAVLQDPMRALRPGATVDEVAAVAAVYPNVHAAMQRALVEAVGNGKERPTWAARKRLHQVWGMATHDAFTAATLRTLQASHAPPKRPRGRPRNSSRGRVVDETMSASDQLTF